MQMVGNGQTRLIFLIPARGLIGYSTEFLSMTRGYGIMNHTFDQYLPVVQGEIGGRHRGALVSIENGKQRHIQSCVLKNVELSLSTRVQKFTKG